MSLDVLQQAVEQLLRDRGWSVTSEGRVLMARRDGEEATLGFLRSGDAGPFADRVAGSSAILAAVLLENPPGSDRNRLEEAGVAIFSQQELEDFVVMAFLRKPGLESSPFVQLLEGG